MVRNVMVAATILLVLGGVAAAEAARQPAKKNARFRYTLADARALQAVAESCPTSFSIMHCVDPTKEHVIPCDKTTCLWDLNGLTAAGPPGICAFIKQIDLEDNLPDDLKPCVLWNQFFGSGPLTNSPKPTLPPIPMPTTSAYIETDKHIHGH
jgi:hypothetical protein